VGKKDFSLPPTQFTILSYLFNLRARLKPLQFEPQTLVRWFRELSH